MEVIGLAAFFIAGSVDRAVGSFLLLGTESGFRHLLI